LYDQAVIFSATDGSIVANLHPASSEQSYVDHVRDGTQVGSVGGTHQAAMWTGSAGTVVSLHPAGYANSTATGVYGDRQVGFGAPGGLTGQHALLWSSSATAYVDLNPFGGDGSAAWGIFGDQQVGTWQAPADGGVRPHAVVWHGTAASAVDLHPAGWAYSYAFATNGVQQVGSGGPTAVGSERALLWESTSGSVVDLHALLPAEFVTSRAEGIDEFGNVIGTAKLAGDVSHAVMWRVPEPHLAVGGVVAVIMASGGRRRRGRRPWAGPQRSIPGKAPHSGQRSPPAKRLR
jgi:hypothetical protein